MSLKVNTNSSLPVEFQKYFWDVNFNELTLEKYPGFISERIINFGNLDGVKWLLSRTDLIFIKTLVKNSRNLNSKTKNYWQLILE